MSTSVIKVENISKKYIISHQTGRGHSTLRDAISDGVKSITKRFGRHSNFEKTEEDYWALKNISFDIKEGDKVGIIGRNGAGKSTLLKILSRITEPTEGRVAIKGRVASLLEVGTGFHAELTGRENIYLNGAILGMSKQEIRRKFEEIVAFSEVEKFLDTPVKRYSSGMYVRLAFSVAAHLEPEILIVDEVLAVGDAAFQNKCLGKMEDVSRQGRTILFVSHNMNAMSQLCSRAILLMDGKKIDDAEPQSVIHRYLSSKAIDSILVNIDKSQHLVSWGGATRMRLQSIKLLDAAFPTFTLWWKQPIKVEVILEVLEAVKHVTLGISVSNLDGYNLLGSHHDDHGEPLYSFTPGFYRLELTMDNPFREGEYTLSFGADTSVGNVPIFHVADAVKFEVVNIGLNSDYSPGYAGLINSNVIWSNPKRYDIKLFTSNLVEQL